MALSKVNNFSPSLCIARSHGHPACKSRTSSATSKGKCHVEYMHISDLTTDLQDHKSPAHKLVGTVSGRESMQVYGARYGTSAIPKYHIPSKVCRTPTPLTIIPLTHSQGTDADAVYQLIHDELTLDGVPLLNLASFVQTWMPKQADQLMMETMSKNLVDQDEYPMTRRLHST